MKNVLLAIVVTVLAAASCLAQTILVAEGFEGTNALSANWTVKRIAATWGIVTNGFAGLKGGGSHFGYCAAVGNVGNSLNPVYPGDMDGYMERQIDLTGFATATLSFWWTIPSIGGCEPIVGGNCDYFQVLLDGVPVLGPITSNASGWRPTFLDLSNYLGARHTLRFEFVSGTYRFESPQFQGAFVDDILVLGQKTLPASVPVNDPSSDHTSKNTQNEPSLILGADGVVLVAFNDSGSETAATNRFTGWAVSTNNGNAFQDRGALPSGAFGDAGDPVFARDYTSGMIYLATVIGTNELLGTEAETLPGSRIQVFRSADNGATLTAPTDGAPGFVIGDRLDKPWMTVDNFPGSGQGNIYLAFRDFPSTASGTQQQGIYFVSSSDHGLTWGPSRGRLVGAGGQGAYVVAGPQHEIYLFWLAYGTGARIQVSKSVDQGLTFNGVTTVAHVGSTATKGDLGLDVRTDSFPRAAVNPVSGQIYVVYNDKGTTSGDPADIFLSTSTDGGQTWSTTPRRVNQDASVQAQWFPTVAVSEDGSSMFIAWYDRRLGTDQITPYGRFAALSGTNVLFAEDFRIGDATFHAPSVPDTSVATYLGDYIQAVADDRHFFLAWTDARTGNSNIRLTRLAIPNHFDPVIAGSGAVRLSLTTYPGASYRIESSSDLMNWSLIKSFKADDFSYQSVDQPGQGARFYRASAQ